MSTTTDGRAGRSAATRAVILTTAERLFAEHGVGAVSNRAISEAAGQGNNTAVGYHFGTKVDLVRAVVREHQAEVERRRLDLLQRSPGPSGLRDWVECLVLPTAHHLASLPQPTWFARLGAQLSADPELRGLMDRDALDAPSLHRILAGIQAVLPADMPADVRGARSEMTRLLLVHACAEHERARAEAGAPADWERVAGHLVDAVTGLWSAEWGGRSAG